MIKIFLFFFLVFMPTLIWNFIPDKKLNVAIINKTVPEMTFRQHIGLTWILNNQKYVKNNKSRYSEETDYYGFLPGEYETYKIKHLPRNFYGSEIIYVTDTYGVFHDDFYKKDDSANSSGSHRIPNQNYLLYGGLNKIETDRIIDSLKDKKKLIVEFSAFANTRDLTARRRMYAILGVEWSGWTAKYFRELSYKAAKTEVPYWAPIIYQNKYLKKWSFSGPGFLFVHENGDVLVIPDLFLKDQGTLFELNRKGEALFGFSDQIGYFSWFDVIKVKNKGQILATFKLGLPMENLLKAHGIPDILPAIVINKTHTYTSYYFGGDFIINENVPALYQFKGLEKVRKFLTREKTNEAFFWRIYEPIISSILNSTYTN